MKKRKLIVVFLFLAVCFSECKKYPEDNSRYIDCSPKCRIVGKSGERIWILKSFLVNGADSTGIYCNLLYPPYPFQSNCVGYQFGRKESGGAYFIGSASSGDGEWHFTKHKKNIVIETGTGSKPLFLSPGSLEWEIEKLEGGEFWLKTIYNDKEYYLKLESK